MSFSRAFASVFNSSLAYSLHISFDIATTIDDARSRASIAPATRSVRPRNVLCLAAYAVKPTVSTADAPAVASSDFLTTGASFGALCLDSLSIHSSRHPLGY